MWKIGKVLGCNLEVGTDIDAKRADRDGAPVFAICGNEFAVFCRLTVPPGHPMPHVALCPTGTALPDIIIGNGGIAFFLGRSVPSAVFFAREGEGEEPVGFLCLVNEQQFAAMEGELL